MSYTPTTWNSGDVVTSAKLNNIETGISNATPLIITPDMDTGTLNHTWQEIHDALANGRTVMSIYESGNQVSQFPLLGVAVVNNTYNVYTDNVRASLAASATSADGYPVMVG